MKSLPSLLSVVFASLFFWTACNNGHTDNIPESDDYGQDTPTAVITAFNAAFPKAENPSWDASDSLYICSFYLGEQQKEAYFTRSGQQVETITYLQQEDLPAVLDKALSDRFPDNPPNIIILSEKKGEISYQADFETGDAYYSLLLSANGDIISEIKDTLSNAEIQEMIDEEDQ